MLKSQSETPNFFVTHIIIQFPTRKHYTKQRSTEGQSSLAEAEGFSPSAEDSAKKFTSGRPLTQNLNIFDQISFHPNEHLFLKFRNSLARYQSLVAKKHNFSQCSTYIDKKNLKCALKMHIKKETITNIKYDMH